MTAFRAAETMKMTNTPAQRRFSKRTGAAARVFRPATGNLRRTLAAFAAAAAIALPLAGSARDGAALDALNAPGAASATNAAWTPHSAANNTISNARGGLEFRAHRAASNHVERAFAGSLAAVSCALQAGATNSPALLSLAWPAGDFIQFGLNSPVPGRLNVRETLGTYPHDYDLGPAAPGEWQFVKIELARDCVRYLGSKDGRKFKELLVSRRPGRFEGSPKTVSVGQDAAGKLFQRPTPWLESVPAAPTRVSWAREVRVEALPPAREAATAPELAALAERERDGAGELELVAAGDPSFESVSRHFPAIKWSREVVGVKDHPFDIGVAADGSLQLTADIAHVAKPEGRFEIDGRPFGAGKSCSKTLLHGWMPVVVAAASQDGLRLEQTVFGWSKGFSPDEPLAGYVRLRAENRGAQAVTTGVRFVVRGVTNPPAPADWQVRLEPGAGDSVCVRVPYAVAGAALEKISVAEFETRLAEVTNQWAALIREGERFEIPEARVRNAYRAWLAYSFLNVARRNGVLEVCDGSGFYGKVYGYSAALFCNALDLYGYPRLAETYCDSLLSFMHTNGLLAVNFGDTDTGTALWVMAEHYRLTRDGNWLRGVAPKMGLMCDWIIQQRRAALAEAEKGPAVSKGLIRYRPYADLLHPAADYFSNGYLWKGLDATARVFEEAGLTNDAANLRREADAYLKDIQSSMDAAVFVDRGMKILPLVPDTRELWKESNESANGYYGIIAPCLLEIGCPAPSDPKARLLTDALEQRGGLVAGISQFHRMADHAYTYGYWLNALERDEVKRAILGLYGSLAYGMSRDTYAAVECTSIRTGENYWMLPHTYSNTQQLRLLRNLLVREEGSRLWLGQAIPRPWLAPGQQVAVNAAPTTFGEVSYRIEAMSERGARVQLSPPTRNPPEEIALRLRNPGRRAIAGVRPDVGGVTVAGDTLFIRGARAPMELEVTFN
jgi:hypothetical protein